VAIFRAVVLFFEGPESFTVVDVAEFHLHGGRAVVAAMLDRLGSFAGWRLAERGEFTRRAVENGRLDLTEAEGIADLVEAETAAQRRQALGQAGGALEMQAQAWRERLLRLLALAEAEIDFPDEGDVPALYGRILREAGDVRREIVAALEAGARGERLREGATIVIAGPPNAGKSTLLNALARREVAIVSPVAGTTRDAIEAHLDLDGYPATLVDTAGLHEAADELEAAGIGRTLERASRADLILWLSAPDAEAPLPSTLSAPVIEVRTKLDQVGAAPCDGSSTLSVSAVTGEGMAALTARLAETVRACLSGGETALVTRARHRQELSVIADHLARAMRGGDQPIELLAEDLRLAVRGIGRLTGRVDVDEIFDAIFRDFCIGK
jgi:tRNA modification GTPase